VIYRLLGVVLTACALLALAGSHASAGVPAGPRLALMRYVGERAEPLTVDASGGQLRRMPGVKEGLSWSADGSAMFFSRLVGRKGHDRQDIYMANADGSDLRRIPGTRGGFDPVASPDGHTLAFARERDQRLRNGFTCCWRATVWILDLKTGSQQRVTPWRSEIFETPASFAPDGSTLALEREKEVGAETRHTVLALHLAGGPPTVLAENATEPSYSPDGTRLALIVTGNEEEVAGRLEVTPGHLAVANVDGSGLTRLTSTKVEERGPSWDPSGKRLAYVQYAANGTYDSYLGDGDSIMEINPDGTCRTKVLSYPKAILFGANWQPGLGREAGPLAC
jgi:TolB protein